MTDTQLPVFMALSPEAREAFSKASLEFLAAMNGWRIRATSFLHINETTTAVDNGVVGPPAFAARPLKWTPRAYAGSSTYANTTIAQSDEAKKYFGMVIGQFKPGTSANAGCQWDDNGTLKEWDSGGADYSYPNPVEILLLSEFLQDGNAVGTANFVGFCQPDQDVMAAGGGLTANVNAFGWHLNPSTGKLVAVLGDGLGSAGTIEQPVADFTANTIYRTALRWRHGGIIHAPGSGQGLHAESKFEWFLNDELVFNVTANNVARHGVLGTVGPRGVAPVLAARRLTTNDNLRLAHFVYAYKGGD
jgi:hypothetical protein